MWRHLAKRHCRNAAVRGGNANGRAKAGLAPDRLDGMVVCGLARATTVVGQRVGRSRAVGTGQLSRAGGRRQGHRIAGVQPVLLPPVRAAGNRRQGTALLRAGCLQCQLGRQGRNGRNRWHWTVGGHRAAALAGRSAGRLVQRVLFRRMLRAWHMRWSGLA